VGATNAEASTPRFRPSPERILAVACGAEGGKVVVTLTAANISDRMPIVAQGILES
jgi:hypothetical protein